MTIDINRQVFDMALFNCIFSDQIHIVSVVSSQEGHLGENQEGHSGAVRLG